MAKYSMCVRSITIKVCIEWTKYSEENEIFIVHADKLKGFTHPTRDYSLKLITEMNGADALAKHSMKWDEQSKFRKNEKQKKK